MFLCSVGEPFLRLGLHPPNAPRGAAVKTGRWPPPQAARSGLDGCEHGAMLDQAGLTILPGHGSIGLMAATGWHRVLDIESTVRCCRQVKPNHHPKLTGLPPHQKSPCQRVGSPIGPPLFMAPGAVP